MSVSENSNSFITLSIVEKISLLIYSGWNFETYIDKVTNLHVMMLDYWNVHLNL